jgi:hypothetical protein
MIHIAAISQIRLTRDGLTYYRRRRAEGSVSWRRSGASKRRISDAIFHGARDTIGPTQLRAVRA